MRLHSARVPEELLLSAHIGKADRCLSIVLEFEVALLIELDFGGVQERAFAVAVSVEAEFDDAELIVARARAGPEFRKTDRAVGSHPDDALGFGIARADETDIVAGGAGDGDAAAFFGLVEGFFEAVLALGLEDVEVVFYFLIGGVAVDENVDADTLALGCAAHDEGGRGVLFGFGRRWLGGLRERGQRSAQEYEDKDEAGWHNSLR